MFGSSVDEDGFQRETTRMTPVSPYGCAKVFGYNITRYYRNAFNLHISNGILFNHESPRRGSNFVTNKVVKTAVEIKMGLKDKLEMGNMDSFRDWGHSKDYVKAMNLIVQQDKADDYVVATGKTRSVRDMCDYVFSQLDLDYKDYVVQNSKYLRPEELKYLRGDSTKIRQTLNWKPDYTFEALMDEMIEHWKDYFSKGGQ
jgi:GDPmannose 4,6-dehydratase